MKSVMKQSGARFRLFHHRTLLTGLLLTLPGFFPVAADSLFFTVTATVVEPTCTVTQSSQDIPMGDIDGATLAREGQTAPTTFSIQLTKCTSTSANLTFTSITPDLLGNFYPSEGNDRGFLLAFTDEQGKHIQLGEEINRSLEPADNTLRFGVQAIRDTGNKLVPGDFSAVATVTIVYR